MYDHLHYTNVREDVLDSLDRYAQQRIPTGGFLEAVLSNNLMEAMGRADIGNRHSLLDICRYVCNELPNACHGSETMVKSWLIADKERAAKANGDCCDDMVDKEMTSHGFAFSDSIETTACHRCTGDVDDPQTILHGSPWPNSATEAASFEYEIAHW